MDPAAGVVVLGDLNEFEFVSPVLTLGESLTNLTLQLPADERYTFNFEGNSQSLDHILVSDRLAATAEFDAVHTNSEFAARPTSASDHDPIVARFALDPICTIEGTNRSDTLVGTEGPDVICAGNGTDVITAMGGDDVVFGGNGRDIIDGGPGDDELYGENGPDRLDGGTGDDLLDGGNGRDSCAGGLGTNDLVNC
jgi:Ca2+-binding RTX toxin-like protein